ncbi:MAG: succinylglutamate desuccinylase/aspartoacylase family protein [Anaerolineae bacterium]
MNDLPIAELETFIAHSRGRHVLRLKVYQLSHGAFLTLPCTVLSNGQEGPRLCLVAGQHGDEWNGVYLIHRLSHFLDAEEVRGTLILLPIANPLAFNEHQRVSSVDGVDLNRSYNVYAPRKPTEHLGLALWESVFAHTDYLIDLHGGGPGEYLPHVVMPRHGSLELATKLNIPYIHRTGSVVGSLVYKCRQDGIKALILEVGQGRSLNAPYLPQVRDGLLNFMRAIEMLSGPVQQGEEPYVFTQKELVPSPVAGFFETAVELGQRVEAGDLLGHVTSIFASHSTPVSAPRAGVILYLRREQVVSERESLVHIA